MRLFWLGLALSGCYLDPPGGGGGDDVAPPPGDGGGDVGPVGRTFFVERSRTSPSCANFTQENQPHSLMVTGTDVFVDGEPAFAVSVRSEAADETMFDPPNVEFRTLESWTNPDGFIASPDVGYRLWISGNTTTGEAFTTFAFLDTVCDYTWTIF
jgi:hypothetical protein